MSIVWNSWLRASLPSCVRSGRAWRKRRYGNPVDFAPHVSRQDDELNGIQSNIVKTGCCGDAIAKSMTTRRISASFHPFPVVASEANRRKDYNRGFGALGANDGCF